MKAGRRREFLATRRVDVWIPNVGSHHSMLRMSVIHDPWRHHELCTPCFSGRRTAGRLGVCEVTDAETYGRLEEQEENTIFKTESWRC